MNSPESIRLAIFIAVLFLCAIWEFTSPRKALTQNKFQRWLSNLGLVGFNSICISLLMPLVAFQAAINAQASEIGLFNMSLFNSETLPTFVIVILSVVILDFAIYIQHVVFHRVPLLWRLHQVHHADQDIDVTTGARFHPIEIILSMWIKIGIVVALGIPPEAVLLFEIILNASAMFNHSNAFLNLKVDSWLRKVIVTPDMHRVHHSIRVKETHSNFGFFLSVWDRWCNTYRAQPEDGHSNVTIGVPLFRTSREQWLDKMLTQPFRIKKR
ncbi:sterol desaturase family protein [Vibrio paucivorans]